MTDENTPFMDYWESVDAAMLKFFGIDTSDAGRPRPVVRRQIRPNLHRRPESPVRCQQCRKSGPKNSST